MQYITLHSIRNMVMDTSYHKHNHKLLYICIYAYSRHPHVTALNRDAPYLLARCKVKELREV